MVATTPLQTAATSDLGYTNADGSISINGANAGSGEGDGKNISIGAGGSVEGVGGVVGIAGGSSVSGSEGGGVNIQGGGSGAYGGDVLLVGGNGTSGGGIYLNPRAGVGFVFVQNLPTADPLVANALWNSAGTLKISAG